MRTIRKASNVGIGPATSPGARLETREPREPCFLSCVAARQSRSPGKLHTKNKQRTPSHGCVLHAEVANTVTSKVLGRRVVPKEAMPRISRRARSMCAYSSSMRKYSAHSSGLSGHMRSPRCISAREAAAFLLCSNSHAAAYTHRLGSLGCSCSAFVTTCSPPKASSRLPVVA